MLSLHSSNELDELSQWLCHDDSTINIILVIIIIITSTKFLFQLFFISGEINFNLISVLNDIIILLKFQFQVSNNYLNFSSKLHNFT